MNHFIVHVKILNIRRIEKYPEGLSAEVDEDRVIG